MLLISNPIRDAILASIRRHLGAVEALLADIKQQPADVTSGSVKSLHETRYSPDRNVSGEKR
jgi:hypothetical protein